MSKVELDVSLIITRVGIFIAVYSLVLGIPFAIAFGWRDPLQHFMGEIWWITPLITSAILATVGSSIYFYMQQRAEDRLLREQRQYQSTLRRASLGMGRIKDLKRLLNLVVHIVTKAVRIEYGAVYLFHQDAGKFILKAFKWTDVTAQKSVISSEAPLIRYLQRHRDPLVYDEVKQKSIDLKDETLEGARAVMEGMGAALVVPSFIDDHLIAFLALGKKKSGKPYSHDDLMVFSILANQAALAIENDQFYEEMKKTHEQLVKAEKMATIGTMADGFSHQINNRLHAMGFIAGDALDTLKLKGKAFPPQTREVLKEIEYSLDRIQDNVKRGGEIVEGLLKYSRKADEGFGAVELDKLVGASLEMAQFKIKLNQIDIVRNFNHSTPKIRGNFTQLQEVLFNIIDNAYDAMMQRKAELAEEGYKGRLEITATDQGRNLEILITDNGIGVGEKDIKRLFTPFFTTKFSSKKGTGLGLYVMRKIIEENHGGRIEFESKHKKGSRIRVWLPIAA
jgi:C4-dicarboxylate-specific signal transduction histidine kinase